ncbi:Stonustoxin subunit alpha [Stylophora pistillata]|uniref:Stonustoxin subunit alpha n=1 Tax=Stylophora pistillata TaxID=50429 RepID=A0A2B4RZI9_STYPI|nr:Stonustoxin subunit alpha [Stylophora pistillata]
MSENTGVLELRCFGQSFQLGMLYDYRSHQPVTESTLWESDTVENISSSCISPHSKNEVFTSGNVEEMAKVFGIDSNFRLSLMTGLVNPSGIGKFIIHGDPPKRDNLVRIILKYETTSRFEELSMDQARKEPYRDLCSEMTATHFVSRIEYGREAIFVFDRRVDEDETFADVEADLKFAVDSLSQVAVESDVHASDLIDEEELSKLLCTFYGDINQASSTSGMSYEDAVRTYSELQKDVESCLKEVPKKVWLQPLSTLDSQWVQQGRVISPPVTEALESILENFNEFETYLSGLVDNKTCSTFPVLKQRISRCGRAVSRYKKNLLKTFSDLLPVVRGGDEAEEVLTDVLNMVASSPFHHDGLSSWKSGMEKEMKLLSTYLEFFKGIQLVSSSIDLEGMDIIKIGKSKALNFRDFVKENENDESAKFIFTNVQKGTGQALVDIQLFEAGKPTKFEPPGRPGKPYATKTNSSSITIGWKESPHGGEFVEMPKRGLGPLVEKVLMVVGATGAGKTTLINGMVNYILGVEWKDDFRYKLIVEDSGLSQANSQTKNITAYTFYPMEGSSIPYKFTIIDTPGFGDTEGLKRDKIITNQIKEFFSIPPPNGIDHLDGIGFVTQASLARLTPPQEYIFDSVLSIFGNDVSKNIFMMLTFADGQHPPVLDAIKKANIPCDKYFKFNNSALFAENTETEEGFDAMFWKMGFRSFQNFFTQFAKSESVSLRLTKEVLKERDQLQNLFERLNPQITMGLNKIEEMRQEELILQYHEKEIETNKEFVYTVDVTKPHQVDLKGTGRHTTTCLRCNYTCHKDCAIADDREKRGCLAMDGSGNCTVCTVKCNWSEHRNLPYLIEFETVTETRTSDDLKKKYETAVSGKSKVQGMIAQLEDFLQDVHSRVMTMIYQAQQSLYRLDEIALKPNPLTQVQYLELLIESEKNEAKPGWRQRVEYYEEAKRQAEILSKVKDVAAVE